MRNARQVAEVLVVEDSPDQAALLVALLERSGHSIRQVDNGALALESVATARPDLVVTDLVMPEMDGLELVEALRRSHPNLPVILVTAFGSGEVAIEALKKGAASYVPKTRVVEDLETTVEDVLALVRDEEHTLAPEALDESRFRFTLSNDESLIPDLVEYLQDCICHRDPECDENLLMQVGIAVQEAIRNAMHHGNLEVSSDLRRKSSSVYNAKVRERLAEEAYASRRVIVEGVFEGQSMQVTVRDEGPGFDPTSVPDPTDPENILKTSGRGMYLISTFMDRVSHNESGNEIVMTKDLTVVEADRV